MDAVFALAPAPRARVLERAAARVPGCLYVCLWAPVVAPLLPSSLLFCLDAWIGGGAGDRARALFDTYRGLLCAVVSGCVPGWAYKDGRAYMELPEPELTASASLQVQQQFYHEAGIKTAVFMRCEGGEVEVGLSTSSAAGVADHVRQSLLEELLQLPPTTRPSSSSSSLLSLSVGSPEYSSLIRSMGTSAASAEPVPELAPPLHPLLAPVYGRRHGELPGASTDDAAMAEAMLAVISSSDPSPTSAPLPPSPPWLPGRHRARRATAFKAYGAAPSPTERPRHGAVPGQRMAKKSISLLARMHATMRNQELDATHQVAANALPPPQPPTSSQLHHMISERRRRERLNDSFQTLRSLLPPGSKKDKANVLASTTEYMIKLIAQVSELQEKNRQLEARLGLRQRGSGGESQAGTADQSPDRVQVDVTTKPSPSASSSTATHGEPRHREVSVRVTAPRSEYDVRELVPALLARLKEMGRFAVVAVDARPRSSVLAQAILTLRITSGDVVDEASLKEALRKAVEGVAAPPPPLPESP